MNTGIQDAANLGWKLAAVLNGADESILDTYQGERHPVGKMVLRSSGAAIRAMIIRTPVGRFLRNNLVRAVLGIPPVGDRIAGMFSGVAIGYHRRGQHKLVGTRYAGLHDTGFVLVVGKNAGEVDAEIPVVRRDDDGPGLLVRPDGYVAWAGDVSGGDWRRALRDWTGARHAISRR
jgi:pentachlorophenol monooxygenase